MRSGFLLAEDEALKEHLKGMTVSDDRSANRSVKVFFRYPENETEKEYPFITVEMVAMNYARNRQHSEHYLYYTTTLAASTPYDPNYIGYFPSELDQNGVDALFESEGAEILRTDSFVQVDLMYQIATYTRNALHDRQLTSQMLRNKLKLRSNYLIVPADGTVRRLDLLSWSQSDLLDAESGYRKKAFRKVYTVQINAEIPVTDFMAIKRVTSVIGNIKSIEGVNPVPSNDISEAF